MTSDQMNELVDQYLNNLNIDNLDEFMSLNYA